MKMENSSRTAKSIKNSVVALVFYLINLILQFFSRKIFLEYLGTEILGLNTTATNLLQFLNLAELGIGISISFTLYGPLANNDIKTIKEICSLQGFLYKRIAWTICLGAIILMAFFPLIFSKMQLPLWYAYASFSVLLFSSLLGYFVNYKQIVLSANQQNYKIILNFKLIMAIKVAFQLTFIYIFKNNGYKWWLIWEVIFAIIGSIRLDYVVRKEFPYLKRLNTNCKQLLNRYPEIVKKTKEVIFHKLSGFILTQTSPLIIYGIISMSMVTIYGNYMLLVQGTYSLLNAFFNGMTASIGNLLSENNINKSLAVFRELFSSRFLLISIICGNLLLFTDSFISLWIGEQYLLNRITLFLILGALFINTMRSVIDSYIYALGLFSDIAFAFIEIFLNIGLSIIFGIYWGLDGILAGVLISLIIVYVIWKPYFLFNSGLRIPYLYYFKVFIKHFLICGIILLINYILFSNSVKLYINSWYDLILGVLIDTILLIAIIGGTLLAFESGMRCFYKRLTSFLRIHS